MRKRLDLLNDPDRRFFEQLLDWINKPLSWEVKSADFTASDQGNYFVGTSGAPVTVTLPKDPKIGDSVKLDDLDGNWGTNAVTVDGNGNTIMGTTTYSLNASDDSALFVFCGFEWRRVRF